MKIVSLLLAPLVACTIIVTAVRIILIPLFLEIEYRTPGFPDDPYGLKLEERLHVSKATFRALMTPTAQECLKCLKSPNDIALYNELELSHLVDVHQIIFWALRFWQWALFTLICIGLIASFYRSTVFIQALSYGAWLTIGILGITALLVGLCFNYLFDLFHSVLFLPESWLFYQSDTLIRLFPERFWIDCALWVTAIAGSISVLILLLIFLLLAKKKLPMESI